MKMRRIKIGDGRRGRKGENKGFENEHRENQLWIIDQMAQMS
jgi:hypothetical protein